MRPRSLPTGSPRSALPVVLVVGLSSALAAGCAHKMSAAPAGPQKELQAAATQIRTVAFEDDFIEARLVFQALPPGVPERSRLREALVRYLLQPIVALPATELRREARDLENDDVFDRIFESFRDELGLYDPVELWTSDPRTKISPAEQDLLGRAARLVLALFSPRGADTQVALAVAALST